MNNTSFPFDRQALGLFFEQLWASSSDPFWICRPAADDFEVVEANAAALRIEPRQTPGTRFRAILGYGPEADQMIERYRECLETGETVIVSQEPVLEGRKRLYEAILVPIKDEDLQVTHIWGTAKDLSRFVLVENALRELNEQLEQRVTERTAKLNQAMMKLAKLSATDSLTGLANRRRFDEALRHEFARMKRNSGLLSLIMLDIDFFKAYNDTYGHLAGDDCLQKVAGVIIQAVNRLTDIAARYGGEEFAIILPETGPEGARLVAEQIRSGIESLLIVHEGAGAARFITASMGVVARNPASAVNPEELLGIADGRLYQAKGQGRNRVVAD